MQRPTIVGLIAAAFGCFASLVVAAQMTARLNGRDFQVSEAMVETAFGDATAAASLPPNGYSGLELLHSSDKELFAKFSRAQRTRLKFGAGEVHEGYCYKSSGGVYLAFNLYAFSQLDVVQLSRSALGAQCGNTAAVVKECIGPYCLGQTRAEVERLLGKKLGAANGGEGLEVAYFSYVIPISPAQRQAAERLDTDEVSVQHNLWFRFDSERLSYIGVWRNEDRGG